MDFTKNSSTDNMDNADDVILVDDTDGVTTLAIPLDEVDEVDEIYEKPCFVASFTEGYSLRNLIEYLKTNNTEGVFKFGPEYITYSQSNNSNTILNDVVIRAYDLIEYEYRGDPNNPICINVNITQLRDITKSIGKKDCLKMYTSPVEGDNYLYIQKMAQQTNTDSRANLNFVRPLVIDSMVKYTRPEFTRSEKKPTCSIRGVDFTKMCKAMTSIKCENVTVTGYETGVIFKSNMAGGQIGTIDKFGKCESAGASNSSQLDSLPSHISMGSSNNIIMRPTTSRRVSLVFSDPGVVCSVTIDSPIIKQLSKINNLSANGNIKLYMEDGNPLKIMTNIGDYGVIRIYVRDS